jgi:hypothetical protein
MLGNLRMSFSISEATRRPHLSLSHADSGDVDEYDAADEFRPNSNQLASLRAPTGARKSTRPIALKSTTTKSSVSMNRGFSAGG